MNLPDFEKIIRTERSARSYLLKHCWDGGKRFCPKCRGDKVYELAEKRLRCGKCRYTFHDFSRRWINSGGLTSRDWLRLLKLFELDLTANRMAPQLGLSYNTVYKALTTLRLSIVANALDARQLLGASSGLALSANGKPVKGLECTRATECPVFGIVEKKGWIFVDLVPHICAETVLHFNLNFSLKIARMGNVVYTDRYRHYDALIFCADEGVPLDYVTIQGRKAYVDAVRGSFWSYIRDRLKRYNGITSRRFPLYLKEIEFRYNNRGKDIFPILVQYLCSQVPDYA